MAKVHKSNASSTKVPRDARTGEFRVVKPFVSSAAADKAREAVRVVNDKLRDRSSTKK